MFMRKKQSFLIGFTLFMVTFIILFASCVLNGIEAQVLKNYLGVQAGDVIAIWKPIKESSNMSPERLLFFRGSSIDQEESYANRRSLLALKNHLQIYKRDIQQVFFNIRYKVETQTKKKKIGNSLYSLTAENAAWMLQEKTIELEEGQLLSEKGVCMSQQKLEEHGVKLGDRITLRSLDKDNVERTLLVTVTGVYRDKADYENGYVFMSEDMARYLTSYSHSEYDIIRIYLHKRSQAKAFSHKLEAKLRAEGDVLYAEDYLTSSIFYTRFNQIMKMIYNGFFVFVLLIIAVGLSTSIRMNLFSRMEEFGTLRAIGYSKLKCYGIIFFEVLLLAFAALGLSLILTVGLVLLLGKTGVYVGAGAPSYFFGGPYFYPKLKGNDILFSLVTIGLFALTATLNPALRLLYQKIADLMAKRLLKIHPIWQGVKGCFRSKKGGLESEK